MGLSLSVRLDGNLARGAGCAGVVSMGAEDASALRCKVGPETGEEEMG